MSEIDFPHQFTPRPYQREVMEKVCEGRTKRAVCVWHRRAGKDKTFTNILATMMADRRGSYFYYFPTAQLGRQILWEGMDREGMPFLDHFPRDFIRNPNKQQMSFETVTGSMFRIRGTDDLNVVGTNPIGVVFSETSLQNPMAWEYTRPILAENGGWAIFNGTPRGKNWFYDLYLHARKDPDWWAQLLTVDDTGAIDQKTLDSERRSMPHEIFQQEFYCSWTAGMFGAIYARDVERAREDERIQPFKVSGHPVHTTWDLGSNANTAVVYWQCVGADRRVIDCDFGLRLTTEERVAHMLAKGYSYGYHFLPHDGAAERPNGTSFAEELRAAGLTNVETLDNPGKGAEQARIDYMRSLFPNVWFREDCEGVRTLIDALTHYRYKEGPEDRTWASNVIHHGWESHPSDAFGLLGEAEASGRLPSTSTQIVRPPKIVQGHGDGFRPRKNKIRVIR